MTTGSINFIHRSIPSNLPANTPAPTIILLHGRGADEHDLATLGLQLDPRLLKISVRAPYAFQYGGYTWYHTREVGVPDASMFQKSYTRLVRFMDMLPRLYPVDMGRVFLFGFSMGAVMAYALTLTIPMRFAGLIAHSGYVPESNGLTMQWQQLRRVRFFVAHGNKDQVIPVSFARRAQELLHKTTDDLTYREYPIAHEISRESLDDISTWLTRQIDSPNHQMISSTF